MSKSIGLSKWKQKNARLAREGKPSTKRSDSRREIGLAKKAEHLARKKAGTK